MKLIIYFFNIAPLYICVQKQNVEMVKLLLTSEQIDVNIKSIQKKFNFLIEFDIKFFNSIYLINSMKFRKVFSDMVFKLNV